ncbi:MAG: hypothetical protein IKE34_06355 [Paenibacillus sp.]|uniref:Uncharacterized protein n=1 Tax=Paenibacillus aquistagni TaxID=1852522 RepID=A0A1X7JE03_9BACL|nr:hypothetical protein [Paenibacillus aquistagni]MBR2568791.1 hypothetical protein [Paenibacillus sp.]NMM54212.1 hypothetical protein [Paenibacillus aquistagni]SMG25832.1 hypothetical protein SAMN06295960_1463 [Paenibacillus aquistagni]
MEDWKRNLFEQALATGIVKDPQWLDRLNEPAPLWVILDIALRLRDQIDPPNRPYD